MHRTEAEFIAALQLTGKKQIGMTRVPSDGHHYIADRTTDIKLVQTLAVSGVWAVHFNSEEQNPNFAYVVDHLPTGFSASYGTLDYALRLLKELAVQYPSYGHDMAWRDYDRTKPTDWEAVRDLIAAFPR